MTSEEVRLAVATALSHETGIDMSPELLCATDRFLAQLWMLGAKVVPVGAEDKGS
jgi:hypothetical protein